jgi:hypothetical protein
MVDKLYFRMKCDKMYISPNCLANEPILERDSPALDHLLEVIKGCNGDITDLTRGVHIAPKQVRITVIDCAGLSTSPKDIRKFVDAYPNIKDIAIDHGKSIEILSRYQLLQRNNVEKFNCRSAPV